MKKIVFILLVLGLLNLANAQEYKHSIRTSPISAILQKYTINYEYAFNEKYSASTDGYFIDTNKADGFSFAFNFKKNNKPQEKATFFNWETKYRIGYKGIFFQYKDSELELEDDNKTYVIQTKAFYIGVNYGAKFIWNNGFTFCYGVGYGITFGQFDWKGDKPNNAKTLIDIHKYISGIKSELSIGFSF